MTEHGICAKCKKSVGCSYADDRITGCKKFVLEPGLELANEEWLRSATFEEIAGAIYEWYSKGHIEGKVGKQLSSVTRVVEWLKEKHDGNVL